MSEETFDTYNVYGLDPAAPGHIIVGANNGNDKIGLWSFDAENSEFAELLYRRQDVDICGVRYHSNRWTNPREVVGVRWCKDKTHVEWFDEAEMALHRQLESIIPNADEVRIFSRSRAGDTLAVGNFGPRNPGTYYLIHRGRIQVVGGAKPYLEAERLAEGSLHHLPRAGWTRDPRLSHRAEGRAPFSPGRAAPRRAVCPGNRGS